MADLVDMMTQLFTAPARASLDAEKGYRKIWIDWLERTSKLAKSTGLEGAALAAFIAQQLDLAPIMKFEAAIDVGVTMRLVSVKGAEGGAQLGLAVGPFQAGGSFSFMSQNTQESVLNARARYQLSNTNEQTLRDYLGAAGIEYKTSAELDAAKTKLAELT